MKKCVACEQEFPETPEFFGSMGQGKKLRARCRECQREANREYYRNWKARVDADPALKERRRRDGREKERRRRKRDPESVNAARRRWRQKTRRDSGRRKAKRELARVDHRLRRERVDAVAVDQIGRKSALLRNSLSDPKESFPRLPARPLARAIDETDARRRREFFAGFGCSGASTGHDYLPEAGALGLAEEEDNAGRMVYAWRKGERQEADFDTVDQVLTRGRWLWWEVYNPETVRRHAIKVEVRRKQRKKRATEKRPVAVLTPDGWRVRHSSYTTAERRFYGDLGTDWETLWEVEHAFTCAGVEHCWACWHRNEAEKARKRAQRQGEQLALAEAA